MTSSPELMGEAQRFAAGDEVVAPSMFLVQVPGFIGRNEFLHLTSSELQLLSQSQPELMRQDGVVIQEATPEILSELNPSQLATTDNNNVKRMFADLGVDLPEAEPSAQTTLDQLGSPSIDVNPLSPQGFSSDSPIRPESLQALSDLSIDQMMNPASTQPAPVATAYDKLRAAQAQLATTEMFSGSDASVAEGIDTDAGQEITPEMAEQLKVLAQARRAGQVGGYFKRKAADAVDLANMGAGLGVFGAGQVVGGLADVVGYLGGGGDFSKGAFNTGDYLEKAAESFIEDGRIIPRLYNPDPDGAFARARTLQVPEQLAQLDSEELAARRAEIEQDSIRAYADAVLRRDPSLFAEGEPVLPLDPDNLPQSIITARRSPAPEVSVEGPYALNTPRVSDAETLLPTSERRVDPPPMDGRNVRGGMFAPNISPQSLSDDMAPAEELMALRAQEAADSAIRMSEQGPNFVPQAEPVVVSSTDQSVTPGGQVVDADGNYVPIDENLTVMPGDARAAADAAAKEEFDQRPDTGGSTGEPETYKTLFPDLYKGLSGIRESREAEEIAFATALETAARENALENAKKRDDAGITKSLTETEREASLLQAKENRAARLADRLNPQGPNFVPPEVKVDAPVDAPVDDPETEKKAPPSQSSVFEDYKQEIQDVLGKGNKTIAGKEKWEDFSLAMFRIAAGKDPNAVTNIAAGLAQAAVDKKASRSVQQDRADKINLLALKMVGDERIANIRVSAVTANEKEPTFSEAVLDAMSSIRASQSNINPMTETEIQAQAYKTVGGLPAYAAEYREFLTLKDDGNPQQYLN